MAKEAKKEEVTLNTNQKKVMELVEKMTALELADLVKALEDKFGVSAVAPAATVAVAPVAGAEETEEKSNFDIELSAAGSNKIAAIKVIKDITGVGLTEAKTLVESAPKIVKEGVGKDEANEIKKKLEEAGCKVELK